MQNMLPNEDLPAAPDAIRISQGERTDPPRPVRRCVVAVKAVDETEMATCEHVKIKGGQTVIFETYVDRLPHILERTRTDAHRAAWRQACEMHENHRQLEAKARQKDRARAAGVSASDDYLEARGKTWNGHPALHLAILGFPTGIPPLESCEVVHPTDPEAPRIDARAFLQLPMADRLAYTINPPPTPATAAQDANERLAATIERAFERMAEGKKK